jgi:heme/copper-type cytochrome/quinol oxidase subunit 2
LDFFLFVLLLVGFSVLYVALSVYLLYTIIILLILALFYIVIKFPRGKEDWPWGFTDNLYTVGMSNVIIIVFILVVPSIPFLGSTLQYPSPSEPEGWNLTFSSRDPYLVLMIILIMGMMYLFVFAILVPYMQRQIHEASGGGGSSGEWEKEASGKPKIGMGA